MNLALLNIFNSSHGTMKTLNGIPSRDKFFKVKIKNSFNISLQFYWMQNNWVTSITLRNQMTKSADYALASQNLRPGPMQAAYAIT